jgi:hypothetical protein
MKAGERNGNSRGRGQWGVTLLDAVIAVTIILIALGVAYPGLKIANTTMSTGGRKDRIQRAGDMMLKKVIDALRGGRIVSVAPEGAPPAITVSRLQEGIDLDDLQEDDAVPWQEDTLTIRFRQTEILKESEVGRDLNWDDDIVDKFALGVLEIVEDETARPITRRAQVMLAMPDYEGDLNGDGLGDPLFTVDGRSVTVRIQLVGREEGDGLLKTVVSGGVRLRNVQE